MEQDTRQLAETAGRQGFPEFFRLASRVLAVLIGFSIPVSTSLAEIATTLFLIAWVLEGDLRGRLRSVLSHPAARWSLALFAALAVATTWSSAPWPEALRSLLKYRELVYLPLLLPLFQDGRLRTGGLRAFAAGALLMLGLSYYEWLSGADLGLASSPNDYVIGKDRIIHSLLLALLAYVCAQELFLGGRFRWLHAAVIALAVPNVLFLVQGRTGYLLLGALTVLCLAQQFGRRGLAIACLLVALSAWGAYAASSTVRARVAQTIVQVQMQLGTTTEKAYDPRLEYYIHTVQLIARHPWRGTGTGSFRHEYAPLAADRGLVMTVDPHNEYMHLAVQAGLPAAGLFVTLLALQWRWLGRLPQREARLGRGVVLAIAVGSLFNSLILSITGGLVWSYFSALALAELGGQDSRARESSSVGVVLPLEIAAQHSGLLSESAPTRRAG